LRTTSLSKHFHSSKNLRIFFVEDDKKDLRIVLSKKNFKLAVTRNKIKRRVKEIFKNNHLFVSKGSFVLVVHKPFAELSFKEASVEIVNAVKSSIHNKVKK
jgi:ribonuclease P protein component